MQTIVGRILKNDPVGDGIYKMVFGNDNSSLLGSIRPGQFIMVKCSQTSDPLFRRPMSVYDVSGETLTIVYKVVGTGTRLMAAMNVGVDVDLLLPCGNGFSVPQSSKRVALVSRGVGTAPLVYLAKSLAAQGKSVTAFVSANAVDRLVGHGDMSSMGIVVHTGVDSDGSSTSLLEAVSKSHLEEPFDYIATCGSRRMLRLAQNICSTAGIHGEVLMETAMACGVGVCKGCVMRMRDGSLRKVCADGPVFPVGDVIV